LLLLFGITLGPFLLVLPAAGWLVWTLTPLQKFYLGSYVASFLGTTQPHNATELLWVLKTAPGRKPALMLPEDAVAGPSRKLPVSLSAQAVAAVDCGMDLRVPRLAKSEGCLGLWIEVLGGPAA